MTDHDVEGCEIVVPKFSWSETWQLPIADYGWAYSQTLKAITGRVNAASFPRLSGRPGPLPRRQGLGLQQGPDADRDHLQLRAERRRQGADDRRHQRASPRPAGSISGSTTRRPTITTAKNYVHRPDAVYVERVYDAASFDLLGIGD